MLLCGMLTTRVAGGEGLRRACGGWLASTSAVRSRTCCSTRRARTAAASGSPRCRPRPNQAVGVLAAIAAAGRSPGRSRSRHPRHDRHHQRRARTQGRQGRADHDARLSRYAGARPPHSAEALWHDRHVRAADPARAAPRGRRAHGCARRGRDRRSTRASAAAESADDAGCESLVIHFLHSYANPAHELRAGEIAHALWPNDYVTLGHALLSEFREYERGTTASVNAAVQPILDRYMQRCTATSRRKGFRRDLLVMNGNGGTVSARLVAREAAKTVMSGPASGVMAAATTLTQSGSPTPSPTTWAAPRPTWR